LTTSGSGPLATVCASRGQVGNGAGPEVTSQGSGRRFCIRSGIHQRRSQLGERLGRQLQMSVHSRAGSMVPRFASTSSWARLKAGMAATASFIRRHRARSRHCHPCRLGELRRELSAFYRTIGRPSIALELMIRMLVVGYCFGIRSDRRHIDRPQKDAEGRESPFPAQPIQCDQSCYVERHLRGLDPWSLSESWGNRPILELVARTRGVFDDLR
jgi:hypothetical protein